MIYDQPDIRVAGDRHVILYFGDEFNIKLNFMAQSLAQQIAAQRIPGINETVPHFASLLIQYDPDVLASSDLRRVIQRLVDGTGNFDDVELESRLISLPVLYFDPWTKECVEDYCRTIKSKVLDSDLVMSVNGLKNARELIMAHSSTEYWVASVGFRPGLPCCLPLDPRFRLKAPKYDPPRTWTPRGAIGVGGAATGFYATASAGGYQIFARTPLPIWDITRQYPPFRENACLVRPGDRLKLIPIDLEEYKMIETSLAAGSYVFNIACYQKFSVGLYTEWLKSLQSESQTVSDHLRDPANA